MATDPCLTDELITAHVAGRLDALERERFAAHLDGCESCRAIVVHATRMLPRKTPADDSAAKLGRFTILNELGAGGMGVVYEVIDEQADEAIALKMLKHGIADPQLIKREFRALADITHPNLVQLYDLFDVEGVLCLTMELVPGVDLMTELRGNQAALHTATIVGSLVGRDDDTMPNMSQPLARAASWQPDLARVRDRFAQLARGLNALHRRGIVHRDIKPHNVRVTPEGRVVLLDFGLAAVAGDTGVLAGTLVYMAPEQTEGAVVAPAVDWYSFGVLLHEVLTGTTPWTGDPNTVLRRKRTEAAASLREHGGAPDDLASLVDDLLERAPENRPDGSEVLERLGQRKTVRKPVSEPEVSVRVERRNAPLQDPVIVQDALVGRSVELGQLATTWLAGAPAWIAIEGASGLGKTSLLGALEQLAARSGVVLHGRCYEREAVAYKGIDQIVDALIARLRERGAPRCREASELVHAFPSANELADATPSDAARHGHDRRGAALRALLTRLAEHVPVLVALDDIQWADRDCLALVAQALAPPGIPGVMITVTARPDASARWLELPMPFARVRLAALAEPDAIELAQKLLGRAAMTIDGVAIARESGGHPLELVERVRSAVSGADAHATARDLLVHRVVNAPADVRLVVELVATAGAPVPVAALGLATGLTEAGVRAALDRAQLAGLVRSRRSQAPPTGAAGSSGRLVVEPAHDHVREVLFAALAPLERAARAAVLAPVLESLAHEPAHVAALYVLAAQPDAARRCAQHAAERMTELGGHDAAAALWRQAAELSTGGAVRTARQHEADSLTLAGRGSEAAVIYQELARSATGSERLHQLRRAAEELLRTGRIREGLAIVETSLPTWREPRGATLTYARALALHAQTRVGWLPRRDGNRDPEELELMWAAMAGHTLGSPGHFMFAVERHLRGALRSGDPEHISLAWSAEATLATFLDSRLFAEACLHRAAAALERVEVPSQRARGIATATAGLIQLCAGMWSRAEIVAADALELFDRTPNLVWERNTSSVIVTTARLHRGELVRLATSVRRERERIAACGDLYADEIAHSGFSVMADLLADEPERATSALEQLTTRPTGVMTAWLRLVAHGLVGSYGHRPAWHRERADALLAGPLALRLLRSPLVLGTVLWTRAALEIAEGDPQAATRWIDRLRKIQARGMTGLAELLAGHAAQLAGDRATARACGVAAELSLVADDMTMFAASARWLADPETWPAWRDALAKAGAVQPAALARVFAPSFRGA